MSVKKRLVVVREDSPLFDELDDLAASGEIRCLDSADDLLDLRAELLSENDMQLDEARLEELEREQEALRAELDATLFSAEQRTRSDRWLWGIGGFLLGGWLSGN